MRTPTLLGPLLLSIAQCAFAEPDFRMAAIIASWHRDRDRGYNERNFGLGIEVGDRWRLVTGGFKNSLHKDSLYAGVKWVVADWDGLRPTLTAGGATGYRKKAKKIAGIVVPGLSYEWKEWGVNLSPLTDEVIGLQVTRRF